MQNINQIAIDGGGSKTRAVLRNFDGAMWESIVGTTRVGSIGVGESCERVLNIIKELSRKSEVESSEIEVVTIGLAGIWLEEEKNRYRNLLKTLARNQKITLNDLIVTSDAEIAYEGCLNGNIGIMLIAGTGTISLAKNHKGQFYRSSGWGIEIDDEGSGAWIGRECLTTIVRALDGRGPDTTMTKRVADKYETFNRQNPRTLVAALHERKFEYHDFTKIVMEEAAENDSVANEIIDSAAEHLFQNIITLSKKLGTKTVDVCLMGGMLENNTILLERLLGKIKLDKALKIKNPLGNAIDGAFLLGYNSTFERD